MEAKLRILYELRIMLGAKRILCVIAALLIEAETTLEVAPLC